MITTIINFKEKDFRYVFYKNKYNIYVFTKYITQKIYLYKFKNINSYYYIYT